MRSINEMTVSGTWKKIGKDSWEMDAGRGWTISVSKENGKFRWEVTGRRHSSSGKESSFKNAQKIGIKQYRQVREERETEMYIKPTTQGVEPDTKEQFQTVGPSQLDDYKLIAKINRRNKMRALNLLKGKSPLGTTMGEENESILRQRKHSRGSLSEARESSFVKKVKKMSDAQRKKLSPQDRGRFTKEQYAPYVQKIADQVARTINAESKKMKITRVDMMSGKLEPNLYNAQGLLENLIMELEDRV